MRRGKTGSTVLVAVVAGAVLGLTAGCGSSDPTPADTAQAGDTVDVQDLQGTYVADTVDSASRTLVPGTTVTVTFEGDRVSVQAGCNTMSGSASVQDGTLVVSNLAGTQMACDDDRMKQDEWLSAFLTSEPGLTLDGDTLTLSSDDVTMELTQESTLDAALVGTAWSLEGVTTGSGDDAAVSSVPQDTHAPGLRFRNGVAGFDVAFSTGCNHGSGPVTIGDEVMDFGALATTKMACPGDLGQLEATFLGVLGPGTTYRVDGDQLTLTAADGKSGLVFSAGAAG